MEKAAVTSTGKAINAYMLPLIEYSLERAVYYLLKQQDEQGWWCDYRLPVGSSNEWVTGFVGNSLSKVLAIYPHWGQSIDLDKHLESAVNCLLNQRHYQAGWGFNGLTGVDADSTAYCMLFLRAMGCHINEADYHVLLSHHTDSGGFSTYVKDDGWGVGHIDVTPIVFNALSNLYQETVSEGVRNFQTQQQIKHGIWPSYWWKNCFYSSYHNLELAHRVFGYSLPTRFPVLYDAPYRTESCFDLAWLIGIYLLIEEDRQQSMTTQLLAELISIQEDSGAWLGQPELRVTDPETVSLINQPKGKYYPDIHNTITTASCITSLLLAKQKYF